MSDALIVAKWCWPEHRWRLVPPLALEHQRPECDAMLPDGSCAYFYATDLNDLARAERILIERGHGRAYAAVLLDHLGIGIHAWCCDHAEVIATAPLSARIRAMASVIRAQA